MREFPAERAPRSQARGEPPAAHRRRRVRRAARAIPRRPAAGSQYRGGRNRQGRVAQRRRARRLCRPRRTAAARGRCALGLERRCTRLAATFAQRVAAGAHRECHGDLHLQNLLWHDGAILAFDALEFDRALRDIDVISEAAFLAMDLHAHGRTDLAYEFLNGYLESARRLRRARRLQFYLVHRALVRAKVAAIKRAQGGSDGHDQARYLAAALELTARTRPVLVITHGLSGSGKTTVTDELVGRLPALRARSDVERKRLHGLAAAARTHSALSAGLYVAAATRRTYGALAGLADRLLRNGQTALDRRHVPRAQSAPRISASRGRKRSALRDPRLHGHAEPSCAGASPPAIAPGATRRKPTSPCLTHQLRTARAARRRGTARRRDGRHRQARRLREARREAAQLLTRPQARVFRHEP